MTENAMNEADKGINVLVVEDKKAEYENIRAWLGLRNHEVRQFDPTAFVVGRQAPGQFKRVRDALVGEVERVTPRVVVLDLFLHEYGYFNGQELCVALRKKYPKPALGLILVTIAPINEDLVNYSTWGADHAWPKPWALGGPAPPPGREAELTRDLIFRSTGP